MNQIQKHLSEVDEAMSMLDVENIKTAVKILKEVKTEDAAVYLVGNGGSAATCSHFANDLVKACGIRAYSIPDMTSLTLAYGNDNNWDFMFYDVIRHLKKSNYDVVFAITCSGNSRNIVEAMNFKFDVILLTGPSEDSFALKLNPSVAIKAMAQEITVVEDVHLMVCHAIIKELMYG